MHFDAIEPTKNWRTLESNHLYSRRTPSNTSTRSPSPNATANCCQVKVLPNFCKKDCSGAISIDFILKFVKKKFAKNLSKNYNINKLV